jgi:hypothetical protein
VQLWQSPGPQGSTDPLISDRGNEKAGRNKATIFSSTSDSLVHEPIAPVFHDLPSNYWFLTPCPSTKGFADNDDGCNERTGKPYDVSLQILHLHVTHP